MNILYGYAPNGEIERINITLPAAIGNAWVTESGAAAHGLYPITGSEPAYNAETHRLTGPAYQLDGGEIRRIYAVEEIPLEEIATRIIAEITEKTQARLDAFARTRMYDDIKSLSDYAGDDDPVFNAEGTYGKAKKSQTWRTLINYMEEVKAGTKPMPSSFSDVEPLLPVLEWPA